MKLRHFTFDSAELDAFLSASHGDPFAFLGPHRVSTASGSCAPSHPRGQRGHGRRYAARPASVHAQADRVHDRRFLRGRAAGFTGDEAPPYRLRIKEARRPRNRKLADPYSFGPLLGELDLHLFMPRAITTVSTSKLGRAPEARSTACAAVRSPSGRPMPSVSVSSAISTAGTAASTRCESWTNIGVWEIFLPGITEEGTHYKFEVLAAITAASSSRAIRLPSTISTASRRVLAGLGSRPLHLERPCDWMQSRRDEANWQNEPVSIYEVHLGS